MIWHEIHPEDCEGKSWPDTEKPFDRLPLRVRETLPAVWELGRSSTGMEVFFNTASPRIDVRYELAEAMLGEDNFNIAGFTGMDLYIFDDAEKRWRWAGAAPYHAIHDQHPEYTLAADMPGKKMRRCRMYLPMRNRLLKAFIGTEDGAAFKFVPPRREPGLVYYGTSIIHGAYSGRSGLGAAQILGRMLDLPLFNLGFSGGAKLEKAMAELLAELDPALYVIDPYHNIDLTLVQERLETFLRTLCTARLHTPVFLLTAPETLKNWLRAPEFHAEETARAAAMEKITRKLMREFPALHFVNGRKFYGSDEVSVDGIHPNDAAFEHMTKILARRILPVLKKRS